MIFQAMTLLRKAMFWKILANLRSKFSHEYEVTKERYAQSYF